MALPRPTLQELRSRTTADVAARLSESELPKHSVLAQLAETVAGAAHSLYGLEEWIFNQTFPDTAESEFLARWADLYGVPRRTAEFARGFVTVRGTAGSAIRAGALLAINAGVEYIVTTGVTLIGEAASVPVEATVAGEIGNAAPGTAAALVSPIAGIESQAQVGGAGIGSGSDEETDAELRDRVLQRLRNPGQGGNAQDYVRWALEVPGVTRAWCYPLLNGLGTVGVAVMRDLDDDPYPAGAALEEIQVYIDGLRPVSIKGVEVFAPAPLAVDLQVRIQPDTPTIRANVQAAIEGLFYREGAADPREPSTIIPLSRISEAISSVDGERSHELLEPTLPPVVAPRELLILGDVLWS